MKAAIIREYGEPEVFIMEERPDPEPKQGQALIDVKAAGINFADIMARLGMYPDAPKLPMLIGYEVAGDVVKTGPGVEELEPGQRVFSLTLFGGYASKVAVPAYFVRPIPESMSYEEAAAIPVNYLTSHHMLVYMGNLKSHETVLIHAAAGGVGTAATQIAKSIGATIIGTASPGKFDYIRENGVDHPVDYRKDDFQKEVMRITNGRGVDIVLDSLGGRQMKKSYNCLAPAGRLVMFGMSSVVKGTRRDMLKALREIVGMKWVHPMRLFADNKAIIGVNLNPLSRHPEIMEPQIDSLIDMYNTGKIKPHVDKTFPLEKVADAHRYIQDRRNKGKVILTV